MTAEDEHGATSAPPHSIEAEQSVLGGLLLDNSAWECAADTITGSDFYRHEHQLIFASIQQLISGAHVADVITVFEHLKTQDKGSEIGGLAYLNALAQSVPSAANMSSYAEIVRDRAVRRAGCSAAMRAFDIAKSASTADDALKQIGNLFSAIERNQVNADARTKVRQLDYLMADAIEDDDCAFDDELIENTLGTGAMGVLYGDSNSGKTFAAIDMGAAVCLEAPWMGRPTKNSLVVYLATESPTSVENRLRAYQRYHGLQVPGFVIVRSPINLFDDQADVAAVIGLVSELKDSHGKDDVLIIGDTLARLSAGANENSGEDMGVVVKNIDAIRNATGAAFLLIHHSGKDSAKGARGWSGIRAATDTEIEVTADDATGLRSAEITKQRDLPGKGTRIGFKLEPVTLGTNRWGAPRGSCVVLPADAPDRPTRRKRSSEIEGAITEFLIARGTGCLKGAMAKHFEGRYVRTSVYREVSKMVDAGLLLETAGVVSLPGNPGSAT